MYASTHCRPEMIHSPRHLQYPLAQVKRHDPQKHRETKECNFTGESGSVEPMCGHCPFVEEVTPRTMADLENILEVEKPSRCDNHATRHHLSHIIIASCEFSLSTGQKAEHEIKRCT